MPPWRAAVTSSHFDPRHSERGRPPQPPERSGHDPVGRGPETHTSHRPEHWALWCTGVWHTWLRGRVKTEGARPCFVHETLRIPPPPRPMPRPVRTRGFVSPPPTHRHTHALRDLHRNTALWAPGKTSGTPRPPAIAPREIACCEPPGPAWRQSGASGSKGVEEDQQGNLKIALRGGGGDDMDARRRREGGGGWGNGVPCRALCFV